MKREQAIRMANKQLDMQSEFMTRLRDTSKVDQKIRDKVSRGEQLDSFEFVRAQELKIQRRLK